MQKKFMEIIIKMFYLKTAVKTVDNLDFDRYGLEDR